MRRAPLSAKITFGITPRQADFFKAMIERKEIQHISEGIRVVIKYFIANPDKSFLVDVVRATHERCRQYSTYQISREELAYIDELVFQNQFYSRAEVLRIAVDDYMRIHTQPAIPSITKKDLYATNKFIIDGKTYYVKEKSATN